MAPQTELAALLAVSEKLLELLAQSSELVSHDMVGKLRTLSASPGREGYGGDGEVKRSASSNSEEELKEASSQLAAQVARMQEGFAQEMQAKEAELAACVGELQNTKAEMATMTRVLEEKELSTQSLRQEALGIESARAGLAKQVRGLQEERQLLLEKLASAQQQASEAAAAHAPSTPAGAASAAPPELLSRAPEAEAGEKFEVHFDSGVDELGLVFEEPLQPPHVVQEVLAKSSAVGKVQAGDELAYIGDVDTRHVAWSEFTELLKKRPVAVTVIRGGDAAALRSGGQAGFLAPRLFGAAAGRLGTWTSRLAKTAAAAVDNAAAGAAAALDALEGDNEAADGGEDEKGGSLSKDTAAAADVWEEGRSAEDHNKPFFDVVRASAAEELSALGAGPHSAAVEAAAFETWLREFHSERSDDWYKENHERLCRAFRPVWKEVWLEKMDQYSSLE
eukprot:TRINITY_DN34534_c0_g1_i1.p1 TRINITY_DN34534_c0_g1~~TRINITY_DN34534_c0_g1_i1.p1  ORF type:complete len:451 (+),score=162.80 TRINITY_DN34534_c0_g1_i1:69-1421(+)